MSEKETSIWMDKQEVEQLQLQAESHRDRLIIQIGSQCGLRVSEWRTLRASDVFSRDIDGEARHFLRVGQEIAKTDAATREVFCPAEVWQNIIFHIKGEGLDSDAYLFQSREGGKLSDTRARAIVKDCAKRLAEETGQERHGHISSHDLRRYHANRLINTLQVDTNIVLSELGWSSFQSCLPYLQRASPENVVEEFGTVGIQ